MDTHHTPVVCGVIPPHILTRVAGHGAAEESRDARATLEHMREIATGNTGNVQSLRDSSGDSSATDAVPTARRRVYDAQNRHELPGRLVMSAAGDVAPDLEAREAWDGSGATYTFYERVFGRRSIDGRDLCLDATVHYGSRFENALWNGRQMVYGDGDGRIFQRFTASVDVIGHELTHGVTQHAAALGYSGQTGALNEHISDAFGSMVRQYTLNQTAGESEWLIGAELFGPAARGSAVRSLAFPGTAYDDPILGRDPQPSHMRDYVVTSEDNGGVHINSGILNHGFYIAAMTLGGKTWEVLGKIWYATITDRLTSEADFEDFTRATTDIAGEIYGHGGEVQRAVAGAWADVGLPVSIHTFNRKTK